jgi:cell division protease FtsH
METPGEPGREGRRPRPTWTWWVYPVITVGLLIVLSRVLGGTVTVQRIDYSTFMAWLDSGRVASVEIGERQIRGRLVQDTLAADSAFLTNRVDHPALVDELRSRGVAFSGRPGSDWLGTLVVWVLPLLFFIGIWTFLGRRFAGQQGMGVMGMSRSAARVYVEKDTRVTFADVAGVDEAKAELQEIVAFLREPASFGRLGARMPKGVLLVGPPGTGKTLLARAVAGEAAVPFFSINGSEFVELFVGVGAARVRSLFEQARASAPCIIFIDEIDALGRARGAGIMSGGMDEKEQTLNQLLAELDGFSPEGGIVVLSATNRPEILDPALLRAGRFDRQVMVDRPDRTGRRQILDVHVKRVRLAADLDLDRVAGLTPGFTGADLANLVNEAALTATRRGGDAVALDDFTVATERIVAGLARKSRVLSPREREVTACHEMGHAIVALATPGADPVQKVSIIPRSIGALGFTLQLPTEDRYIATRGQLEAKMAVLLGGRAAELVVFGELSTGAADDLVHATEMAREMVMRHGMDPTVGHVVYGEAGSPLLGTRPYIAPESRMYSEQTAREIEVAVRTLVEQALERSVALLSRYRAALDEGTRRLVERETLSREELPVLEPPVPVTPDPSAAPARRLALG